MINALSISRVLNEDITSGKALRLGSFENVGRITTGTTRQSPQNGDACFYMTAETDQGPQTFVVIVRREYE